MIRLTLVTGRKATLREAAIAKVVSQHARTALILEGLPDGSATVFEAMPHLTQIRIAPGCLCCTGNLTLRVMLNRMLRQSPDEIYISLANDAHMKELQQFLSSPPYDGLLHLTEPLFT